MAQDIRNTQAWQRLRRAVISDQPWCSACGSEEDLTADHITPLIDGGEAFAVENIQVLCRSCNSRKGAREGARARRRGGGVAGYAASHPAALSLATCTGSLMVGPTVVTTTVDCSVCGSAFSYERGRGRPREKCDECMKAPAVKRGKHRSGFRIRYPEITACACGIAFLRESSRDHRCCAYCRRETVHTAMVA